MKSKEELQKLREQRTRRLDEMFNRQFEAGPKEPYDFRPGSLNSVIGIGAEQLRNGVIQQGDAILMRNRTSPVTIGIGVEQLRELYKGIPPHFDTTVPIQKRTSPVTIAPLAEPTAAPGLPRPLDSYEHCIWLAEFHEKAGNFEDAAKCYGAASERQPGRKAKRYKEPVWLRILRWLVR